MFRFKKTSSKGSQTDVCCGCITEVRCNKNACTQYPEEKKSKRALSSIDFIPVPHRSKRKEETEDQVVQHPEDSFTVSQGVSVAGSSLEGNFGDSEEDKEFKEVIE